MAAPVYSVIATLATLAVTPTVATRTVTATPVAYVVEPWPDATPAPGVAEPLVDFDDTALVDFDDTALEDFA